MQKCCLGRAAFNPELSSHPVSCCISFLEIGGLVALRASLYLNRQTFLNTGFICCGVKTAGSHPNGYKDSPVLDTAFLYLPAVSLEELVPPLMCNSKGPWNIISKQFTP